MLCFSCFYIKSTYNFLYNIDFPTYKLLTFSYNHQNCKPSLEKIIKIRFFPVKQELYFQSKLYYSLSTKHLQMFEHRNNKI